MRSLPTALLIIAILAFAPQAYAIDFTIQDFDPPDATQVDSYTEAVNALVDELTVTAADSSGTELFTALPMTMELIALETQIRIHESAGQESPTVDEIIAQANNDKPVANSFAFVVDGDPVWVRRNVTMYISMEDGTAPVEMPVVPIGDIQVTEGGYMTRSWAFMAENDAQLDAFLKAPVVVLAVGEGDESVQPIYVDCGFWRRYALFDLRETTPTDSGTSQAG